MSDTKPRVNVQIDRIVDHKEEVPPGKQYKIGTFICDGFINGEPATAFTVRAIGKDKIAAVRQGFSCEMEIDNYKGHTKYEIPRDFDPGRATYAQTSPVPTAGRTAAPVRQASQERSGGLPVAEFDELFVHAMDVVSTKLIALKMTVGEGDDVCADTDTFAKLVPTYIIAAMDNGVRMPRDAQQAQPEQEKVVDFGMLLEILEKKNLTARVETAEIGENDLVNMWKASGDSKLKFGMLVEESLKAKEGGGDNTPF